jgi:cell fate regulator YaaT (PSP1 superfamily)
VKETLRMVQLPISKGMLPAVDWMKGMKNLTLNEDVVEVRFKNNRKSFYRNTYGLVLSKNDRVVVEAQSGHDLGTVSLIGANAEKQFGQKAGNQAKTDLKKIYRKATRRDIQNWLNTRIRERDMMLKARKTLD